MSLLEGDLESRYRALRSSIIFKEATMKDNRERHLMLLEKESDLKNRRYMIRLKEKELFATQTKNQQFISDYEAKIAEVLSLKKELEDYARLLEAKLGECQKNDEIALLKENVAITSCEVNEKVKKLVDNENRKTELEKEYLRLENDERVIEESIFDLKFSIGAYDRHCSKFQAILQCPVPNFNEEIQHIAQIECFIDSWQSREVNFGDIDVCDIDNQDRLNTKRRNQLLERKSKIKFDYCHKDTLMTTPKSKRLTINYPKSAISQRIPPNLTEKLSVLNQRVNDIEQCENITHAFQSDWELSQKQVVDTWEEKNKRIQTLRDEIEARDNTIIEIEEYSEQNIGLLLYLDQLIDEKNKITFNQSRIAKETQRRQSGSVLSSQEQNSIKGKQDRINIIMKTIKGKRQQIEKLGRDVQYLEAECSNIKDQSQNSERIDDIEDLMRIAQEALDYPIKKPKVM